MAVIGKIRNRMGGLLVVVVGGALVIPIGMLQLPTAHEAVVPPKHAIDTTIV
mgnify:CR=1 FL=1